MGPEDAIRSLSLAWLGGTMASVIRRGLGQLVEVPASAIGYRGGTAVVCLVTGELTAVNYQTGTFRR